MKTDNELIAEFHQGLTFNKDGFCTDPEQKYSWRPGCFDPLRVEHLGYDKSWDWLMPVVEKIEQTHTFTIFGGLDTEKSNVVSIISMHGKTPLRQESKSKIEAVYKTVIEFIKWYNSNKKP